MQIRKPKTPSLLDETIEDALRELKGCDASSQEYAQIVSQLTELNKIRNSNTDRVSKDTLVAAGANLAGILVIVGYESKHLITSKALSFIKQFK